MFENQQKNLRYNADKLVLGNEFLPANGGDIDICTSNPTVNKITINGVLPGGGAGGGDDPLFLANYLAVGYLSTDPIPAIYAKCDADTLTLNNTNQGNESKTEIQADNFKIENLVNPMETVQLYATSGGVLLQTANETNTLTSSSVKLISPDNALIYSELKYDSLTIEDDNPMVLAKTVVGVNGLAVITNAGDTLLTSEEIKITDAVNSLITSQLKSDSFILSDNIVGVDITVEASATEIKINGDTSTALLKQNELNFSQSNSTILIGSGQIKNTSLIGSNKIEIATAYTEATPLNIIAEKPNVNEKIVMSATDIVITTPENLGTPYSLFASFLLNETSYQLDVNVNGIYRNSMHTLFNLFSTQFNHVVQGVQLTAGGGNVTSVLPYDLEHSYDMTITFANAWLPTGVVPGGGGGATTNENYRNLKIYSSVVQNDSTYHPGTTIVTTVHSRTTFDDIAGGLHTTNVPVAAANLPIILRKEEVASSIYHAEYIINFPNNSSFLPATVLSPVDVNVAKINLKRSKCNYRY